MLRQLLYVLFTLGAGAAIPAAAQHEHSPEPIRSEHHSVFALVADSLTTHMAHQSGLWSDPATWMHGQIPDAGARVVIPAGVSVELAQVNPVVHKTIRVDGTLHFATQVDTTLLVDTLIVSMTGHLQIGTVAEPVASGVRARLVIADTGPIDLAWDPLEFSRGLISHGRVTMHGEVKTSHADLAEQINRRDRQLVLATPPVNWQVGDVLVVPGTRRWRTYDETVIVTGIDGAVVEVVAMGGDGLPENDWSGFSHRHKLPDGLTPFVINLTRNVAIESENVTHADEWGINRRRGHVMFMHSGVSKTDTRFVGAYGLGRTDKRTPLESPELDEHGQRLADRGHNAAGRYAWHFHRGGPQHGAAVVEGLAIVHSPGLGLVNHSSHVEVSNSVAYNVMGSAWFTEAGDETGFFHRVAAIRMPGSGQGVEGRTKNGGVGQEEDFGHGGHGFWLQGGGVTLHDVRVSGAGSAGIIFFTRGLDEGALGVRRFDASLVGEEIAQGSETLPVGSIPLVLDEAFVFASTTGVETKFHQLNARHEVRSLVSEVTTAETRRAMSIQYTNQLDIVDSAFIGNLDRAGGHAIKRNKVTRNIHFQNLEVRGWYRGLDIPIRGTNRVSDGVYQNVRDITIKTTRDDLRVTEISGDVQFLPMTEKQLTTWRGELRSRHHIYLATRFNPEFNDLTRLFARDVIRLGTVLYQDRQLYYFAQAADFVPFPAEEAADYVPEAFIDRTNAELYATYGLAIGDALAPADAFIDPTIHGLVGAPISYPPRVKLRNRTYTNDLTGYRVRYRVYAADGTSVDRRWDDRVDLQTGWNLITFEESGHLRTLMIFGDIIAPTFQASEGLAGVINPLDLKRGFRVTGLKLDNSFGEKRCRKKFSGSYLLGLPRYANGDGTEYVQLVFTIKDFARNETEVAYVLVLDENEPLAHQKRRVVLEPQIVTMTLFSLLGAS